jgi:hypothetical protein
MGPVPAGPVPIGPVEDDTAPLPPLTPWPPHRGKTWGASELGGEWTIGGDTRPSIRHTWLGERLRLPGDRLPGARFVGDDCLLEVGLGLPDPDLVVLPGDSRALSPNCGRGNVSPPWIPCELSRRLLLDEIDCAPLAAACCDPCCNPCSNPRGDVC